MTKIQYIMLMAEACRDGIFPSISDNKKSCLYRGPGNKRCAIGILIPDEMYREEFDNMSIYDKSVSSVDGYSPGMAVEELADFLPLNINDLVVGLNAAKLTRIQYRHDSLARRGWNSKEFIMSLMDLEFFDEVPTEVWEEAIRVATSPKQEPVKERES